MESEEFAAPVPIIHRPTHMSYMFGPHIQADNAGIYFGGDNRIVRCNSEKIPIKKGSVPTWLIVDWIRADARGEPISNYAQIIMNNALETHKQLQWVYNQMNR